MLIDVPVAETALSQSCFKQRHSRYLKHAGRLNLTSNLTHIQTYWVKEKPNWTMWTTKDSRTKDVEKSEKSTDKKSLQVILFKSRGHSCKYVHLCRVPAAENKQ